MKRINTRAEFIEWSRRIGVRPDWHEPDEQSLTARVEGTPMDFDNAGFWPTTDGTSRELHVIFSNVEYDDLGMRRRGRDFACVNLATLCAWATGYDESPTDPRFPKGGPEYDDYAAILRAELTKFARREPPYGDHKTH